MYERRHAPGSGSGSGPDSGSARRGRNDIESRARWPASADARPGEHRRNGMRP